MVILSFKKHHYDTSNNHHPDHSTHEVPCTLIYGYINDSIENVYRAYRMYIRIKIFFLQLIHRIFSMKYKNRFTQMRI